MDNYEFCAQFARTDRANRADFKVLDYGCGAGTIIGLMRQAGLEAVGCDVFYGGGSYLAHIPENVRPFVFRMEGDRAPFSDATFDLVINNQVLEHVTDLDVAVREIARVLKPGGSCLSLFPDKSVWREGHCGIPFLHWFPKKTAPRIYYASFSDCSDLASTRDQGHRSSGLATTASGWMTGAITGRTVRSPRPFPAIYPLPPISNRDGS